MADGSFTVEAALLMTILIPVLVSLIYAGFYIHDRALLQGVACEIAALGSNLAEEQGAERILNEKKEILIAGRLLGTRKGRTAVSHGKDRTSAVCSGTFVLPGLIARFFRLNEKKLERSWSRSRCSPADLIRKIRGVKYMADKIRE